MITMTKKIIRHFVVRHPLGMHARVCSKWIRTLQQARPEATGYAQEWAWILYNGKATPADSLFKLLELRLPCGAEFDLEVDELCAWTRQVQTSLEQVIAHPDA